MIEIEGVYEIASSLDVAAPPPSNPIPMAYEIWVREPFANEGMTASERNPVKISKKSPTIPVAHIPVYSPGLPLTFRLFTHSYEEN